MRVCLYVCLGLCVCVMCVYDGLCVQVCPQVSLFKCDIFVWVVYVYVYMSKFHYPLPLWVFCYSGLYCLCCSLSAPPPPPGYWLPPTVCFVHRLPPPPPYPWGICCTLPCALYTVCCRCLQFTTFVERTFCTETEKEREEWMAAITKISDALKKKGDNLAQQKSNGTNEKQDKEVAKVCMFYVCTYVNSMCVRM